MKYSKKIVNKICDMLANDRYSIQEVCKVVGITDGTFRQWRRDRPDFAEALDNAHDRYMDNMMTVAARSLRRKLEGYDVTETNVVTVPGKEKNPDGTPKPRIKEQRTTKKHVAADTAAIIFTLTNGDPVHWQNRRTAEVTGKDGKDLFSSLSDAELEKSIEELKRKLDE